MSSDSSISVLHSAPGRWYFHFALVALWIVLAPAAAFAADDAQGECDEEKQTREVIGLTPVEVAPTPCAGGSDYDPYSYNICFIGNPRPMSTMPKLLAAQQARDAVGVILEEVHALHRPAEGAAELAAPAVWQVTAPTWLDEFIDELQQTRMPFDPGIMCIERPGEQGCERAPTPAVTSSFGTATPVFETSSNIEIPWRPGDNESMQPPLVDLRVGPSQEHRSLPERPPCA